MNRTVVAVLVALIAVLAIGVAVGGSSKKSAFASEFSRSDHSSSLPYR